MRPKRRRVIIRRPTDLQTAGVSVGSDTVKQTADGCSDARSRQQKASVRHKLFVAITWGLWWWERADGEASRVFCREGGRGGRGGVRWICLPLLLPCYDQSNEICGELGFSFRCITHTLSCTGNPLWDCPQTHPLRWMDAFADVSDNRASFSRFFFSFMAYI